MTTQEAPVKKQYDLDLNIIYCHKGEEWKYPKTDGHKFKVPELGPIQQASQCHYGDCIKQVHVLSL